MTTEMNIRLVKEAKLLFKMCFVIQKILVLYYNVLKLYNVELILIVLSMSL